MPKLKFCGIRTENDIDYVNQYTPDYIGFVFAPGKRQITPIKARQLRDRFLSAYMSTGSLKDRPLFVGVFVNETPGNIESAVKYAGLDIVQLHGDESDDCVASLKSKLPSIQVIRAVRLRDEAALLNSLDTSADFLLFDAYSRDEYGGTGKSADLSMIERNRDIITKPFFIAGGLNADNLNTAIALSPYGLDISSGIETNGVKDPEKMANCKLQMANY